WLLSVGALTGADDDESDGDEQQQRPQRDEQDAHPRITLAGRDAAEKEAYRDEQRGVEQEERDELEPPDRPAPELRQSRREADLNQRQQRAVGVGQRPHLAAQLVVPVEVETELEAVQELQERPQAEEQQ